MPRIILETPYLYSNALFWYSKLVPRSRSPVSRTYIRRNSLPPIAGRLHTCSSVLQLISTGAKAWHQRALNALSIAQNARRGSRKNKRVPQDSQTKKQLPKSVGDSVLVAAEENIPYFLPSSLHRALRGSSVRVKKKVPKTKITRHAEIETLEQQRGFSPKSEHLLPSTPMV